MGPSSASTGSLRCVVSPASWGRLGGPLALGHARHKGRPPGGLWHLFSRAGVWRTAVPAGPHLVHRRVAARAVRAATQGWGALCLTSSPARGYPAFGAVAELSAPFRRLCVCPRTYKVIKRTPNTLLSSWVGGLTLLLLTASSHTWAAMLCRRRLLAAGGRLREAPAVLPLPQSALGGGGVL
jgi:hypothetical protein